MAIWLTLTKPYTWKEVSEHAKQQQLSIGDWRRYDLAQTGHNAIRLGFATYNEAEISDLIQRLQRTFTAIDLAKLQ